MTTDSNTAARHQYDLNGAPAAQDAFADLSRTLTNVGQHAVTFTLAGVLGWIGAMKFTAYEAGAIKGLVASSPFTSWLYDILSLQGASNLIGSIEIITALLIIAGIRFQPAAIAGALGAIATFLVTLSFLFSAPGWEASLGGFPALSVVPGQFLLKDAVLLAASIWLLGNALKARN